MERMLWVPYIIWVHFSPFFSRNHRINNKGLFKREFQTSKFSPLNVNTWQIWEEMLIFTNLIEKIERVILQIFLTSWKKGKLSHIGVRRSWAPWRGLLWEFPITNLREVLNLGLIVALKIPWTIWNNCVYNFCTCVFAHVCGNQNHVIHKITRAVI